MDKTIKINCTGSDYLDMDLMKNFQGELKTLSDENKKKLKTSIIDNGFTAPIFIWKQNNNNYLLDGHQRMKALTSLKSDGYIIPNLPICYINAKTKKEAKKLLLHITSQYGEFDVDVLTDFVSDIDKEILESIRLTSEEIVFYPLDEKLGIEDNGKGRLSEAFGAAPFSVLNARSGWWQDRKREWLSLGINSGVGRKEKLLLNRANTEVGFKINAISKGTSIFDPVLCELMIRWFSSEGDTILDPFAGGSVRGIVAGRLGRNYFGSDLSNKQVKENRKQATEIFSIKDKKNVNIAWECLDSREIDKIDINADMIFSCPPYVDLEVYSDDPKDLSTLKYCDFIVAYEEIIAKSCTKLKDDSFACFVVGEVRDKKGNYYNFVGDTIKAFEKAGLNYYNEIIFVTQVGTLAMTSNRVFSSGRKIGKTHQNVLVFVKGAGKKATLKCGEVTGISLENVEEVEDE